MACLGSVADVLVPQKDYGNPPCSCNGDIFGSQWFSSQILFYSHIVNISNSSVVDVHC